MLYSTGFGEGEFSKFVPMAFSKVNIQRFLGISPQRNIHLADAPIYFGR